MLLYQRVWYSIEFITPKNGKWGISPLYLPDLTSGKRLGKRLHNYIENLHILMGKSTNFMAIFNNKL